MGIIHEILLPLRFARSGYRGMLSWPWVVMLILSATPSSGARQQPGTSNSEHPDPAWNAAALVVGALALTTVVGVAASLQSFLGLKARADGNKSRGRAAAGADRSVPGRRQSAHDHDKKEQLDVYQLPKELHLPQRKSSLFSLWTSFPWRRSGDGAAAAAAARQVHWLGLGVLTSPVRLELRQAPNRRRLTGRRETTAWEYEYDMLAAATSKFHKKMKLGPGQGSSGSGVVFKGTLLGNNGLDRPVAIKRFHSTLTDESSKHVHRDLGGRFLRHKNIVRLLGYCLRKGKLYLVYDYMPNGSLDRHLFDATGSSSALTWARRSNIIRGVALGLNHLHSNKSIHGSVKASNVMLEKDLTARLGDLGYSRMEPSKPPRNSQTYMAPECAANGGIPNPTSELDVFYFGALVLEVVCGRRSCCGDITDGDTSFRFLADWVWALHGKGRIIDAVDPSLQSTAGGELQQDEEAKKLLLIGLACSHPDPMQRLRMGDVVEMLRSDTSSPPTVPPLKPEYHQAPAECRVTVG